MIESNELAVRLDTDRGITVGDVYEVAVHGARLDVGADCIERLRITREVVERVLKGGRKVYGLNTYVGHLRDVQVPDEDLIDYQHQLIDMHARGIGAPLPEEDVRALLLARIAGMAHGGSGAHPEVFLGLVELLNRRVHPVVPQGGSVGASDLTQMAAVGQVLMGRGEATYKGDVLSGDEALRRAGISPVRLRPKDGLALISANGFSIGLGALTVVALEKLCNIADAIGCLSLEAIGGSLEPFQEEVVAAKPFDGQMATAAHMRECLTGSYLERIGASVQDPLSFRVMPQVHGALREHLFFARRAVQVELNSSGDNPMVSLEQDDLISNGNFHPVVLALSFETLRLALAHLAMISERRINRLRYHGVPAGRMADFRKRFPFRPYHGPSVHSASALLAEIKHMANPVTLSSSILNPEAEDHSTLAPQAVTLTRTQLERVETLLAIEALMAYDVLTDDPNLPMLGHGTAAVCRVVAQVLEQVGDSASASVFCETVRARLFALPEPAHLS
jgi:histidine ammonia-lyase